jgi:hypothetical protein
MAININVVAICPDKQVEIERVEITKAEELAFEYAMCSKEKDGKYKIILNMAKIKELWENSWLYDYVTMDVFEAAFTLHELAHVKYTIFEDDVNKSNLAKTIKNILEDARVEYQMSYDFPESSIFFNILLSTLQSEINGNKENPENGSIESIVYDLFDLARYNIINDNSNKELINKMLPFVVLMRRGSPKDCDIACEIILNLIQKNMSQANQSIPSKIEIKQKAISEKDRKKKQSQHNSSEAEKQIASKFFDEKIVKEKIEKSLNSNKAGNAVSVVNKERTSFFLQTAIEHKNEIASLRSLFDRAFVDFKNIAANDGDLNFAKQQSAYINSIIGEEGKDYQYRKKERVLLDVVLLRDISGSISNVKDNYAKSIVILLSALENIDGIRTAQIDFNSNHYTNKTFDSGIEKATINPVASGGTSIRSAYQEVLKYQFKGKRNLVIVISDGDFIESQSEVRMLESDINKMAKIVKFAIGGFAKDGYKSIAIKDIPKEMAKAIIKEGLM